MHLNTTGGETGVTKREAQILTILRKNPTISHKELAERLGIDHVAANRLEVVEGRLTGRVMGRIVDRQEKVRCLIAWAQQDGVPMERTIAVGDGANDLGMLEAAGLGVAFCAKPVVVEQADAAIHVRDLRAVLQLIGG